MAPGSRVGPYDVVACIGVGGMGEVYRARDTRLGRDVALKVLPDVFARDPDRLSRFEREAKTLASLNHPNIAQIHGLEEADGVRALVLEFVEGPTLADRIARGLIPLDEALPIARQIALGLEAAHEQGVVHRDLKPGNVKVRPDGTVKILDFGLARALDASGTASGAGFDAANSPTITSPAMTGLGVILGTAAYMSPEQARGRPVDRRADIWAFGCVLYEMLSGRRAFQGDDVSSTLAAVLKDVPDSSALPAGLPPPVARLLRRCLQKDPKNRLSAIADARLELDELDDRPTPVEAGRKPWPLAVMLACAVLGALIAAGAMWGLRRSPVPAPANLARVSLLAPEAIQLHHDTASAAVSPDGRAVAFVTIGPAGTELWVRDVAALSPRRLDRTNGASLPFWSPDSARVAFFAGGKLKIIAVGGGRVDPICDAQDGRGGTWSPNGTIVFAGSSSGPLMKVSSDGGDPTPVTTLDSAKNENGHRFPFFLPDGDHFLFAALSATNRNYEIFVGSLTSSSREPVGSFESAPIFADPGYLLFTRRHALVAQRFDPRLRRLSGDPVPLDDAPDGVNGEYNGGPGVSASPSALLYLTSPLETTRIIWMDASGKLSDPLDVPRGTYGEINLSPDHKTAAVVRLEPPIESTIWLLDLRPGGGMRPLIEARARNYAPVWAHDGTRLFFSSDREGAEQIYVKDVNSSAPEEILVRTPERFKQPLSASADGRWLLFQHLTSNRLTDISRVDLSVRPLAPEPLLQGPFAERSAEISPDGRWIAYVSDEGGAFAAYVDKFPELGRKTRVADSSGQPLFWGADSRRLVVIADGPWLVELSLDAEVRVVSRRQLLLGRPDVTGGDVASDLSRSLVTVVEKSLSRRSLTLVTNWSARLATLK